MLDLHKKAILDAMGVKLLHPRYRFVAAKPSPLLTTNIAAANSNQGAVANEPAEVAKDVSDVEKPLQRQTPDPAISGSTLGVKTQQESKLESVAEVLADLRPLQTSAEKLATKNTADAALSPSTGAKPLKFRYRFIRVGALLMMIEQPALEWKFEQEAKKFFSYIYFALSAKQFEYWHEVQFDWPPGKQFAFAEDHSVARETLLNFVKQQCQHPRANHILLWGNGCSQHLFDDLAAVGELLEYDELNLLQLHSLTDYWQQPENKKLLWQYLQPIRKALTTDQC